jgi:long-chain acyl-CoA synthetase
VSELLTAPAILLAAAEAEPERVRFVLPSGERVTLGAFALRVRAAAGALRARGIRRGQRVAIFAPNSIEWAVAALGVQLAGAAFAGVHAGSSAELTRHIVAHSQSSLLLACPAELARAGLSAAEFDVDVLGLDSLEGTPTQEDRSTLEDTACLIYTSGTTGQPKGVVLSHANLAANGRDWVEVCGPWLSDETREVTWLPFSHVFGWGDLCIGTLMGFTSHLVAPAEVVPALGLVRPHLLMTVPILLERLAAAAPTTEALRGLCGGSLEVCLSGGAPLSSAIKRRYRAAGVPVVEGYGLSETSPTLTLERGDEEHLDTVGLPYPSVELRLADDGEIEARGPSVFSGYFDDPQATAAVFTPDGWFRTGDLGAWTARGQLRLVGRKKELIVLQSGKKVAPSGIESAAAEDSWFDRAVVFGDGLSSLVALLVLDPLVVSRDLGRSVNLATISSDPEVAREVARRLGVFCATRSRCERIRHWVLASEALSVEAGTLTPSFKVRRNAVWDRYRDQLSREEVCI